jgi:DNA-binding NarL/FixJ family response regulator
VTLRVVIAEDNKVCREGVRAVLEYGGEFEVVAAVDRPDELLQQVDELVPDAVITDIRMPPTHHMEGIEAAHEIRRRHPGIGILVLSQHADDSYAFELLKDGTAGFGYLLKERIGDDDGAISRALKEVVSGRSVIDPEVVDGLVSRPRPARRHCTGSPTESGT